MWFGEPHSFPETGSPTRLSTSGRQRYEGWSCIRRLRMNGSVPLLAQHAFMAYIGWNLVSYSFFSIVIQISGSIHILPYLQRPWINHKIKRRNKVPTSRYSLQKSQIWQLKYVIMKFVPKALYWCWFCKHFHTRNVK